MSFHLIAQVIYKRIVAQSLPKNSLNLGVMKVVLSFLLAVVTIHLSFGQKKDKPVEDYLPTDNLEMRKDDNTSSNRPKKKNYSYIYVSKVGKILYGNPCAIDETRRMGFEYVVEPRTGLQSKTRQGKFLNNLWVKTKLVFTRSPFWEVILTGRIKKCKRQTGDFVG